ncbi:MAG: type II toxin-antitoxin system PemK/MazF family toxin [Bacteroidota bacterium]|nr:type II toxin-antitoxin system PemK/MazF family toxin [Bacteroidota bacterium]
MYKWEIWLADLDPVIGSEQGKTRPVLIVSENYTNSALSVVNILPLTTRKNSRTIYPNETLLKAGSFGLPNESIVLCYQVRTIDKRRLIKLYGTIADVATQNAILDALKFQFGIT